MPAARPEEVFQNGGFAKLTEGFQNLDRINNPYVEVFRNLEVFKTRTFAKPETVFQNLGVFGPKPSGIRFSNLDVLNLKVSKTS